MSEEDIFNGATNEDLQFDQNAFLIFSSCLLFIVTAFKGIKLIIQYKKKQQQLKDIKPQCKCQSCHQRYLFGVQEIQQENNLRKSTIGFILLLSFFVFVSKKSLLQSSFKSFDPFNILEIDSSATDQEIKKAFQKMAKIHHPDKNRNDPNAHKNFILISKAYSCIKDEKARSTCLYNKQEENEIDYEYQVGIALPSFILDKRNQYLILSLLFIIILFIIPAVVYHLYQTWDQTNDFGVKWTINYVCMQNFQNDKMIFQQFLMMIIQTEELVDFNFVQQEQIEPLLKLKWKGYFPFANIKELEIFQKPFMILWDSELQDDFLQIQKRLVHIIDSVLSIAVDFVRMDPQLQIQILKKEIHIEFIERLLGFSQMFYQGLIDINDQLIQLPDVNYSNFPTIYTKFKNKSIQQIINSQELILKLGKLLQQDKYEQKIESFKKHYPNTSIEVTVIDADGKTMEFDQVKTGQLNFLKIKIEWENQSNSVVHSKFLNVSKKEKIYILTQIGNEDDLWPFELFIREFESSIIEVQCNLFLPENIKELDITISVCSDSYVGTDILYELKIQTVQSEKIEKQDQIADEDIEGLQFFNNQQKAMQNYFTSEIEELEED